MPHRAYIVNLEHISSIIGSDILMCDGQRIPISRSCGKDLKDAYLKFCFNNMHFEQKFLHFGLKMTFFDFLM